MAVEAEQAVTTLLAKGMRNVAKLENASKEIAHEAILSEIRNLMEHKTMTSVRKQEERPFLCIS